MKKNLCIAFFLLSVSLVAQVAISTDGSNPDNSAVLDVKSTNKGLLPPRVALTAINSAQPVSAPAVGLFVYNTATAGAPPNNVVPGNYCWNGTRWVAVAPPPGANVGELLYWNGAQWITLPSGSNGQVLTLNNGVPQWGGTQKSIVFTVSAGATSPTTANITGNVFSDGGESTVYGICYSLSPNPTLADATTVDGTGIGQFTRTLTGLIEDTLYYVRAYATNSIGTVYGNERTFATELLPSVTTDIVTDIAQYTALSGGYVTSQGFAPVIGRGVCWSTSQNPTIADSHTNNGSGTGAFVSNITGLTSNTTYYLRAYATNSMGTSYGNQRTFTTLSYPFYIGQSFGGGIICYIDQTGLHGLIAAASDQFYTPWYNPSDHWYDLYWGCYQSPLVGNTGTNIGSGQANTTSILNVNTCSAIAPWVCDNLVLNGKSDWFLPSKDELNQLYIHRVEVGGFITSNYWSSSEVDINHAWSQNFNNGNQSIDEKGTYRRFRAIRTF